MLILFYTDCSQVISTLVNGLVDGLYCQVSRTKARLRSELYGYGLKGLDHRLIRAIDPSTKRGSGFFVELGASDGLAQSNTYLLQRRYGWTGLLIEPSQARFLECVRNRGFGHRPSFRCAACVDPDFRDPFVTMQYSDLMSVALDLDLSVDEALSHSARGRAYLGSSDQSHVFGALACTLTSLLNEVCAPPDFDLLSIDVEGNELCVLRGLDFTLYRPHWILLEVRSKEIVNYIESWGYRLAQVLSDYGSYQDLLFESA